MVELHAAWTQAARVGATAGRAGTAEAAEEAAAVLASPQQIGNHGVGTCRAM